MVFVRVRAEVDGQALTTGMIAQRNGMRSNAEALLEKASRLLDGYDVLEDLEARYKSLSEEGT